MVVEVEQQVVKGEAFHWLSQTIPVDSCLVEEGVRQMVTQKASRCLQLGHWLAQMGVHQTRNWRKQELQLRVASQWGSPERAYEVVRPAMRAVSRTVLRTVSRTVLASQVCL